MPVSQEVIAINDYLQQRIRTTGAGTKSRFTLSVKSEPIFHFLDPVNLGAGPAEAIRKAISDGIKAISQVASPATILRRKTAANSLNRGQPGALARYSGGKTGTKPPGQSDKLFNDSGRLADGVFVRQNPVESNWTVNVPNNRLDPSTFKDMSAFERMVSRLRDLVPAIRNPLEIPAVQEAIKGSFGTMLIKANTKGEALTLQRIKLFMQLGKEIADLISGVASLGG